MQRIRMVNTAGALMLSFSALATAAVAQTPEEFYRGRQLRFVVGTATGQEYDHWARLIARHYGRHIPGNPSIVVENMPGAGHILATNYLYSVAPKDGSVIGMVSRNMTDAAVMGIANVRFDPLKFNWLGSPEVSNRVMYVTASSGIAKVPDLFVRELIVGAPGGAQGVTAAPMLLKNLLGMKLKIVQGYHSPNDVELAMTRGEVQGLVSGIGGPDNKRAQQWLSSGIRVLFNMEPKPLAWTGAPTIFDYIKTEEQRQVFTFFANNVLLGRPIMTTPGVPAARVAALRRAFDATMKDEAFLQEAKTMGLEIMPKTGEQIAALVAEAVATPKDVVKKAENFGAGGG